MRLDHSVERRMAEIRDGWEMRRALIMFCRASERKNIGVPMGQLCYVQMVCMDLPLAREQFNVCNIPCSIDAWGIVH